MGESAAASLVQVNGNKCHAVRNCRNDCDEMECGCNAESSLLSHHQYLNSHSHNGNNLNGNGKGKRMKMNGIVSESGEEVKRRKEGCCDKIEAYLEHLGKGTTWLSIIIGQVASLLLTVSAITSVYLIDVHKLHFPNAQNFSFYILLATIFTSILACRPAERNLFPILRTRGWKYAFVALADAEANFLVTKSYQLTTLTSVQLLDCFAIPTVLSLSWLLLQIRFKVPHIVGVSVSLLGLCCLVWADVEDGRPLPSGKNRFVGDMICLSGAFLHGVSNVAQEFVVKTFDVVEFLAMVGLFGSFISGAQTLLLEYGAVASTEWSPSSVPAHIFLAHAGSQFLFYVCSAFVMKWSGATACNLSLLTADFYCLIVGIFLFRVKVHPLYFLSFVLVMSGVLIFNIKPTILASHIYKSLTREVTTTLDLELMASTPNSYLPNHSGFGGAAGNGNGNHPHYFYDTEGSISPTTAGGCGGGQGALRLGNKSSLLNNHHLQQHNHHHNSNSNNLRSPPELLCNTSKSNVQPPLLSTETCDVVPRPVR